MLTRGIYLQRQLAALLVTGSGVWQVASLWLDRLSESVLLTALCGAVYLLIGIGLFGQSRFTLFIAICVPGALLALTLAGQPVWTPGLTVRAVLDLLIVLLSARVLWALRHQPSI